VRVVELDGGQTRITLDASATPDLQEWVDAAVVPLVREWYPELRRMLPSPGYEAPRRGEHRVRAGRRRRGGHLRDEGYLPGEMVPGEPLRGGAGSHPA
jgi:hypothetical protein